MYQLEISPYIEILIDRDKSKEYIRKLKSDIVQCPFKKIQKQKINEMQSYYKVFDEQELIKLNQNHNATIDLSFKQYMKYLIKDPIQPFWTMFLNIEYQYYQNLLESDIPSFKLDIIEKDVIRTTQDEEIRKKLRNILIAYSKRNGQLGYCQGFNYIGYYYLSRGFDEEHSFWLMSYLFESILPPDYYNFLIGVLTDDQIIRHILETQYPVLYQHLEELEIETSIFTIQMLVCCFTCHTHLADTIMDLLFVDGSKALIKSILVYITLLEKQLLESRDIGMFMQVFDNFRLTFFDRQFFLSIYCKIYLNNKILNYIRQDYSYEITMIIYKNQKSNKPIEQIECQFNQTICRVDQYIQNKVKFHQEYMIFRQSQFNIIDNYEQTRQRASILDYNNIELLTHKSIHICNQNIHTNLNYYENLQNCKKQYITIEQKRSNRARSPIKEILLLPLKSFETRKIHIPKYNLKLLQKDMNQSSISSPSRKQLNKKRRNTKIKSSKTLGFQQMSLRNSESIKFYNQLADYNQDIGLSTINE